MTENNETISKYQILISNYVHANIVIQSINCLDLVVFYLKKM